MLAARIGGVGSNISEQGVDGMLVGTDARRTSVHLAHRALGTSRSRE